MQFWLHFLTGSLCAFLVIYSVVPFRPQSVDSWDGGSTDELKKAAVEKKKFEKF